MLHDSIKLEVYFNQSPNSVVDISIQFLGKMFAMYTINADCSSEEIFISM